MATAAMMAQARLRADRIFYSGVPLVVAAFVLVGFGPSWFVRPVFGRPEGFGPLDAVLILHGTLMTLWLAFAVAQPLLIASGNRRLHRTLGTMAAGVAAMIVPVVPIATIHSMRGGGVPVSPSIHLFFAVNVVGVLSFGGLVALAIAKRREVETHKRLMTLSLMLLLPPAISRIPMLAPLMPLSGFGIAYMVIVAGCIFDRATRGRIHPVWKIGGPIVVAIQLLSVPLGFSAPWVAFGNWAMRLPV